MGCGCGKKKINTAAVNKVTVTKQTRPLSEGGRTRRTEKRIIR